MVQVSLLFPQLLFLGDSITQFAYNTSGGIIPVLQDKYQRQVDVVNRGFSGYNTEWLLPATEPIFDGLSAGNIEYSVIFLGSNDASSGYQGVPISEYGKNLQQITETALQRSNAAVIVGPGIVNEDLWKTRTNVDFYKYGREAERIAKKLEVPYIDLWAAFRAALNESSTLNPLLYNNTNSTSSGNMSNSTSISNGTYANGTYANGTYANGTYANRTTSVNGTSSNSTSKYPYLGLKGNPKNYLLDEFLVDGLHFTDKGYQLWLKALTPILEVALPQNHTSMVLPSITSNNGTEYVEHSLVQGFVAQASAAANRWLNLTQS